MKIIVSAIALSIITVQPVARFGENVVHFGWAKAGPVQVHIPVFAERVEAAEETIAKAEAEPEYRANNKGDIVAAQALTFKGYNYRPGVSERCAEFVRFVLAKEGITLPTAQGSLGPLMADSFYAPEAGIIIKDPAYLRPGDIVMFGNTYNGGGRNLSGWQGNQRVTHVGIYVGDDMMIDRSTRSRPVNYRSIHTDFNRNGRSNFHSALRPNLYGGQ